MPASQGTRRHPSVLAQFSDELAALQPLGAPYKAVLPVSLQPSAGLAQGDACAGSGVANSSRNRNSGSGSGKAVPGTARACELPQLVIAPTQHPLSVYAQLLERA